MVRVPASLTNTGGCDTLHAAPRHVDMVLLCCTSVGPRRTEHSPVITCTHIQSTTCACPHVLDRKLILRRNMCTIYGVPNRAALSCCSSDLHLYNVATAAAHPYTLTLPHFQSSSCRRRRQALPTGLSVPHQLSTCCLQHDAACHHTATLAGANAKPPRGVSVNPAVTAPQRCGTLHPVAR
jgi:hypothetical protein